MGFEKQLIASWGNAEAIRGHPDGTFELPNGMRLDLSCTLDIDCDGAKISSSGKADAPIWVTMQSGTKIGYQFENGAWFRLTDPNRPVYLSKISLNELPAWKIQNAGVRINNCFFNQLWSEWSATTQTDASIEELGAEFANRSVNGGLGKPYLCWLNSNSCGLLHWSHLVADWGYFVLTRFDRIGNQVNIRITGEANWTTNFRWRFVERLKWIVAPWFVTLFVLAYLLWDLSKKPLVAKDIALLGGVVAAFFCYAAYKSASIDFNYKIKTYRIAHRIWAVSKRLIAGWFSAVGVVALWFIFMAIIDGSQLSFLKTISGLISRLANACHGLGFSGAATEIMVRGLWPLTIHFLLSSWIRSRSRVDDPSGSFFHYTDAQTHGLVRAVVNIFNANNRK